MNNADYIAKLRRQIEASLILLYLILFHNFKGASSRLSGVTIRNSALLYFQISIFIAHIYV